ncbi:MAG: C-type lectin domain-containing protein [Verrucomicrobiota bacterium]
MKNKYRGLLVASLGLLLFASPLAAQAEEIRVFTNSSGKTIRGSIVTATSEEVTIKLESGQTISGGVTFFSEMDQKFIQEWVKKNPTPVSYDFDVDMSRERTDRNKKTEDGNTIVTYENWRYKLTLENRSKIGNNGSDVDGLELHYNIVKVAKANANEARYLHKDMRSSGGFLTKSGKIKLPALEYLREKEFTTETIPINQSELAPGWYYTDGSKDEKEDEFEGIWVKIVKDNEPVFEKKLGNKGLEKAKWVNPS